jgi:hypothetical protein
MARANANDAGSAALPDRLLQQRSIDEAVGWGDAMAHRLNGSPTIRYTP